MTAYYNENDPKAAAWLRELIIHGHIAPGVVDERSIDDVSPNELYEFTQCHFFAGIGGWSYALRLAGWSDDTPVWTGSCPCQPFSAAGKGGGLTDERHLWPAWFHFIDSLRPPVLFGEQVASPAGLGWFDVVSSDLEGAAYAVGAVDTCAASVGAPHIRQRLYWVAHAGQVERGRGSYEQRSSIPNASERIEETIYDQRGRPINELAHADSQPTGRNSGGVPGAQGGIEGVVRSEPYGLRDGGAALIMADSCGTGLEVIGEQPAWEERATSKRGRAVGKLGNAGTQRQQQYSQRDGATFPGSQTPRGANSDRPNAWVDCEWIACRDRKSRPVEPGTFPLAHGVSNRVVKLRGLGNAIVPQQAAAFIRAYLDVT